MTVLVLGVPGPGGWMVALSPGSQSAIQPSLVISIQSMLLAFYSSNGVCSVLEHWLQKEILCVCVKKITECRLIH